MERSKKRATIATLTVILSMTIGVGIFAISGPWREGQEVIASPLSGGDVAALATQYAQGGGPDAPRLTGLPHQITGKIVSRAQSDLISAGRAQPSSTTAGQDASRSVWIVVVTGEFADAGIPGGPLPPGVVVKHWVYDQALVTLDAATGELITMSWHPIGTPAGNDPTYAPLTLPANWRDVRSARTNAVPPTPAPTRAPPVGAPASTGQTMPNFASSATASPPYP
jgi:hypothetical protein